MILYHCIANFQPRNKKLLRDIWKAKCSKPIRQRRVMHNWGKRLHAKWPRRVGFTFYFWFIRPIYLSPQRPLSNLFLLIFQIILVLFSHKLQLHGLEPLYSLVWLSVPVPPRSHAHQRITRAALTFQFRSEQHKFCKRN